MIYQCYKHKGDCMNGISNGACVPAEPKSRIAEIYEHLQALGIEVVELQRIVNLKRVDYYAINAEGCESEKGQGGTINDIDWMIGDIKRMVLDVREYVETL